MNEQILVPGASEDWEDRKVRSFDFGRMVTKTPATVATPRSVEDVSAIVRRAARDGIPIALRGGGHSQGGQSLTHEGLLLDTMHLNRIEILGEDRVRAQGGTPWGKIVDALQDTGTLPRVLTDSAEVTVGGTLSAGGLGTTSHRYGLQTEQVELLEVVTGTGERVMCSNTQNKNIFDAVRGGQGQFGVITEAWIRLRNAGKRIRQYELRYRDFEQFAYDFERVVGEDRFDRLRAETRVHDGEIIMGAGIEYDEDHDDDGALEDLRYDEIVSKRDTARVGRAGMYLKWLFSPRNYYPWRDWFMPWKSLREALVQSWLDLDHVPSSPGSWIGIYPIATATADTPLLMHPKGERMFSYSILAVLDDYNKASELAERLKEVDRALVALGAKAYLSGGVGYGYQEWKEHFGDKLELGLRWKEEFDPKKVFRGTGLPFGSSQAI